MKRIFKSKRSGVAVWAVAFLLLVCALLAPAIVSAQNPVYGWTRRIGGSSSDLNPRVSVDANGNVYLVGDFQGTVDFAADFGGVDAKTSAGGWDGFITRVNADGAYTWTRRFGGSNHDHINSLSIDSSGNIYVTGDFRGTVNFAADFGANDPKGPPGSLFLTRINANGTYGWTKIIGGTSPIYGRDIQVDSDGNLYLTGAFLGTADFGADFGATDLKTAPAYRTDAFVTRINGDGTYGWTRIFGGSAESDEGHEIAIVGGIVYVMGTFQNTVNFAADFGGNDSKTSAGGMDIFLLRMTSAGAYEWTRVIGGSGREDAGGLDVDVCGNVFMAGDFTGSINFAADFGGSDPKISAVDEEIFVTHVDPDGSYGWTRRIGGIGGAGSTAVSEDRDGFVYVTGAWGGGLATTVNFAADFGGTDERTSLGAADIFITRIKPNGDYGWTRTMGGGHSDYAHDIFAHADGYVYSTSEFGGPLDFAADFGGSDIKATLGGYDISLTKIIVPLPHYEGCDPTDSDYDGLNNGQEIILGTDPNDYDTDDDGLSDGDEFYFFGTDPLYWDTDVDALPDGFEVENQSGHTAGIEFDPIDPADGALDYDGDLNPNAHEYWNGTDPWVKDPVGAAGCFFWGEANGDDFIGALDINILTSRIKGQAVAADYANVIPNTGDAQDLDDDGFWGALDITLLTAFAKGQSTAGIASRPVSIDKLSATTVSVQAGYTTHVNVALRNSHSFPPGFGYTSGFGVVFSIDPSSTGTAVILGGDGANPSGYRYDMTGAKSISARSNMVILVKTAGTIKINASIPQCGLLTDLGRYCSALTMTEPFVITGY